MENRRDPEYDVLIIMKDKVALPSLALKIYEFHPQEVIETVKQSVKMGIRFIDSSAGHQNEQPTGFAIQEIINEGVWKREDFFVATNVYVDFVSQEEIRNAVRILLHNLNLDYVDLALIHVPMLWHPIQETLMRYNFLLNENLVKSFGGIFWGSPVNGITIARRKEPKFRQGFLVDVYTPCDDGWTISSGRANFGEVNRVLASTQLAPEDLFDNWNETFTQVTQDGRASLNHLRADANISPMMQTILPSHGLFYSKAGAEKMNIGKFTITMKSLTVDDFSQFEKAHIARQMIFGRLRDEYRQGLTDGANMTGLVSTTDVHSSLLPVLQDTEKLSWLSIILIFLILGVLFVVLLLIILV